MSTPKVIAETQSVSRSADDIVDADRPTAAKSADNAAEDGCLVQEKNATTIEESKTAMAVSESNAASAGISNNNAVAETSAATAKKTGNTSDTEDVPLVQVKTSDAVRRRALRARKIRARPRRLLPTRANRRAESKAPETLSLEESIDIAGEATVSLETADKAKSKNVTSSNRDKQNKPKSEEPNISATDQIHASKTPNPHVNCGALKPVPKHTAKVAETADDASDSRKIDSSQEPKTTSADQQHQPNPLTTLSTTNDGVLVTVTTSSDEAAEKKSAAEVTEKTSVEVEDSQKVDAGSSNRQHPSTINKNDDMLERGPKLSHEAAEKKSAAEVTEKTSGAVEDSQKADTGNSNMPPPTTLSTKIEILERDPKISHGAAEKKSAAEVTKKTSAAVEDAQKLDTGNNNSQLDIHRQNEKMPDAVEDSQKADTGNSDRQPPATLNKNIDILERDPKISHGATEMKSAAEVTKKTSDAVEDSQTLAAGNSNRKPDIHRQNDAKNEEPENIPMPNEDQCSKKTIPLTSQSIPKPQVCDDAAVERGLLASAELIKIEDMADSHKEDAAKKPSKRSRARSLSSAVSSLSGGESIDSHPGIDAAGASPFFDNNGKTPRQKNGRIAAASQATVTKLCTNKGRILFRKNSETAESLASQEGGNITTAEVSNEDTILPPLKMNEGTMSPPGVTFVRRPRSSTIDSFRAAMDSQFNNLLPSESIVLPAMKDPEVKEADEVDSHMEDVSNAKKMEDIFGLTNNQNKISPILLTGRSYSNDDNNNQPLSSPRGRFRSDTIDFLTSAVEFRVDDNDSAFEDVHPTPINITKAPNNDKASAKKVEINLKINETSSSNTDNTGGRTKNKSKSRSLSIDLEPFDKTARYRSDTIDFLTSAVEFQVDDDDSAVEDGKDMHPTPIHVTNASNADRAMAKKEESNLKINESPSLTSDDAGGGRPNNSKSRNMSNDLKPRSLCNDMNKGVAFGKTPRKTNLSRVTKSQSSSELSSLRKRYRTRSLSFALSERERASRPLAQSIEKTNSEDLPAKCAVAKGAKGDEINIGRKYRTRSLSFALPEQENTPFKELAHPNEQKDQLMQGVSDAVKQEDDIATESDNCSSGRDRSNTLDSFHAAVFGNRSRSNTLDRCLGEHDDDEERGERRSRSDTLEFLTAAVAGDMGHDLDAAMAAAGDDGASYVMHTVSAPSGASVKFNNSQDRAAPRPPPGQKQRPRSNTLDSTASSINSAKLDFLVSVASEIEGVTSPVLAGGQDRNESVVDENCENSVDHPPQRRPRSNTLEIYSHMNSTSQTRNDTVDFLPGASSSEDMASARARSDTVDFLYSSNDNGDPMANIDDVVSLPDENGDENGSSHNSNVMDHLKALCDEPKISGSKTARLLKRKRLSSSETMEGMTSPKAKTPEEISSATANKRPRKNSEATWKTNVSLSQDSFMASLTRNRLESWGGMSDLSTGGANAAMHTALKDTGILDDVLAAAADLGEDDASSEICTNKIRAAATKSSTDSPAVVAETSRPIPARARLESVASMSLGELSDTTPVSLEKPVPAKKEASKEAGESVGTKSITVDYGAIAAAVNAANAATEGLDLTAILGPSKDPKNNQRVKQGQNKTLPTAKSIKSGAPLPKSYVPHSATKGSTPQSQRYAPLRPATSTSAIKIISQGQKVPDTTAAGPKGKPFPVTTINIPFVPIPKCTKTKEELDAIRARARAAAGYVPPPKGEKMPSKTPPPLPRKAPPGSKFNPHLNPPYRPGVYPNHMRKRGMPPPNYPPGTPMMPDRAHSNNPHQTPLSYIKNAQTTPSSALSSRGTPSATLQSQQKWDDMFACLVRFIEETREKCTKQLTDEDKATWIWDGNVPTSYKTACGKALGRWINNQRSAKAKGTLKDDREVRLVSTGLKWSVLTTNSWRQMVRELEIYVNEQTQNGRMWDGNVPTNYKIKSNFPPLHGADDADDEKNLGRWVNRQRSLFQAGKLKKDRQRDLERIGLKWSVLLTTSWSAMFESLKIYAEEKRTASPHNTWDGNVPANFKTRTNPPLSLGRWVNRQRSAHAKGRLKEEYVKKLEVVGLKWVIHTRHVRTIENVGAAEDNDEFEGGEFTARKLNSSNNTNLMRQTSAVAPPSARISTGSLTMSKGKSSTKQASSSTGHPPMPPLPPVSNAALDNKQAPSSG